MKKSEAGFSCPKCGGKLFEIQNTLDFMSTLDGNSIYQCECDKHRFWSNPRQMGIRLHLNMNASVDNYDFEEAYELVNDNWIQIEK